MYANEHQLVTCSFIDYYKCSILDAR